MSSGRLEGGIGCRDEDMKFWRIGRGADEGWAELPEVPPAAVEPVTAAGEALESLPLSTWSSFSEN